MEHICSSINTPEPPWRPEVPGDGAAYPTIFGVSSILGAYVSVSERPSATVDTTDGSRFGRRSHIYHRDSGLAHPTAAGHSPVKGTWQSPSSSFSFARNSPVNMADEEFQGGYNHNMGGLPKLNFPNFDGSCPKLWQKRCEDYFDMYATEAIVWVKVATIHFQGVMARWLQSIEPCLPHMAWHQFCQAIHDRFGREQHELVIIKLFHIRQRSSVQDYVDRYCELIDLLVTYEHNTDPLYYTMKFIDGLHEDIKSVILIQRPDNLDTDCALALLQEEAMSSRRHEFRAMDGSFSSTATAKTPTLAPLGGIHR